MGGMAFPRRPGPCRKRKASLKMERGSRVARVFLSFEAPHAFHKVILQSWFGLVADLNWFLLRGEADFTLVFTEAIHVWGPNP